jgi:hypothetical protein
MMKILARHTDWVSGCTITESDDEDRASKGVPGMPESAAAYRRFTATILGWQNFKIYEGFVFYNIGPAVQAAVKSIKERIEKNDESVFKKNFKVKVI